MFLVPYYAGEAVNLSRYAASLDYHIILREIAEGLAERLKEKHPTAHFVGYGDHSPIDEVGAALISGLGIRGDNGLIINPEYGSYVFIGDLLTDIDPEILGAISPAPPARCYHCGACKRACPTGILRGEGADCLSAVTQRKGDLTSEEKALMQKYNTAWGCDMCQSVCPYNKAPKLTPVSFFYRERIPELTLDIIKGMTRVEFSRRAFAWRGRKTVERNLEILAENN
ncbi:MAG: epoxyqueuosine reductase [Clostridia bacterium]|nr:epoxyqueuosine reductase [Clostridia bacterium]